ncbi:helix-turn-helix domain-containing protein [Fodinicola acaciae]|uniref:helix-turn-helix domain-containing protein n=1 Tax=Fodinicola acaciae TaxID=2681555 RepID=UPI0013D17C6D|nr:LysR family transcriptional regulator [Fodinicola acaciae]
MEGLILRLSALDADAENALRVIGFFDRLITGQADLDSLVRHAAQLAECPAGVTGKGLFVRADAAGKIANTGRVPDAAARMELADGALVWLERGGNPLPLDAMVLERFGIAAAAALDHSRPPKPELGDPALVELVLSETAGSADRSRALQLLGIRPTAQVVVLAVRAELAELDRLVEELGGRPAGVRTADFGARHAVLLVAAVPEQLPPHGKALVGVGDNVPAMDAPQSWRAALCALRFAYPGDPVVRAADLGGFGLLAEKLTPAEIAGVRDVQLLDRLAGETDLLEILLAVATTESVRKAAAAVFRHHSTVAARLAHAESVLGFAVDTPAGRSRLHLALLLRRLRDA